MKGSLYPFKVRIKDPELARVLIMVNERRVAKIPNIQISQKVGQKLKPIRRDIIIGNDRRYNKNFIALPPELNLDFIPKGKAYDFIFRNIF